MNPSARVSVAAVSYLNTVPLVWGMQHGPQRSQFQLDFCVPSECARRLEAGIDDLGIVPVAEVRRQSLDTIAGCGIACNGAVRSILLFARRPWDQVRILATDSGSRTSVQLARVILARKFGAEPACAPMHPDLDAMLDSADAALLIGDAALHVDPATLPWPSLDLGEEWLRLTGLPMVFATWSGRRANMPEWLDHGLKASLDYGRAHIDDIVRLESARRGFTPDLVREYLTRHIVFDIGPRESLGLERFLAYSAELDRQEVTAK